MPTDTKTNSNTTTDTARDTDTDMDTDTYTDCHEQNKATDATANLDADTDTMKGTHTDTDTDMIRDTDKNMVTHMDGDSQWQSQGPQTLACHRRYSHIHKDWFVYELRQGHWHVHGHDRLGN